MSSGGNNTHFDSLTGTFQSPQSLDALLQTLLQERNALRQQNEHLYKLIEQQRSQIVALHQKLGEPNSSSNLSISNSGKRAARTSQQLPQIHSRHSSSSSVSITQKSVSQPGYLPGITSASPPTTPGFPSLPVVPLKYEAGETEVHSRPSSHENTRFPRMPSTSTAESPVQYPESEILREINRVHVQYSTSQQDISRQQGRSSTVEYAQQSDSRSPSRPLTAKRERSLTAGKRTSVGPIDGIKNEAGGAARSHRVSSFSKRPVLQDISPSIDPKSVTTMATYKIAVVGESVKTRKNKEVVTLIFSITDSKNPSREYWRCEKVYSDMCVLDLKLRQFHAQYIERIPDKSVFAENSNRPFESRKRLFDTYVESIREFVPGDKDFVSFFTSDCFVASMPDTTDEPPALDTAITESPLMDPVIHFATTDIMYNEQHEPDQEEKVQQEPEPEFVDVNKKAYLAKKGKGQNGYTWKRRFFALRNGLMDCFEKEESATTSGTIKLKYCMVAPKLGTTTSDGSVDPETQEAFTIIEYKKGSFDNQPPGYLPPDNRVNCKYVLLPESLSEAHAWLKSIQANIDIVRPPEKREPESSRKEEPPAKDLITGPESNYLAGAKSGSNEPAPPSLPQGNVRPSSPARNIVPQPIADQQSEKQPPHVDESERIMKQSVAPLSSTFDNSYGNGDSSKSLPLKGQNSTGNLLSSSVNEARAAKKHAAGSEKEKKKMSIFFTKKKSSGVSRSNSLAVFSEPSDASKHVFGVTLEQAIASSRITDNYELPAVIYRCIEYLEGKEAIKEEGIFRLSGSSSEIQKLKERFNQEGDVDLLNSTEFYDVHAVSGLLKLWFRELASPVLTAEMQPLFMNITEIPDRDSRVGQMKLLLSQLPRANYTLIRALMGHLISIVQNHGQNKMTARNVGIVFAPTLSIPSAVFTLMMSEYSTLFIWDGLDEAENDREQFSMGLPEPKKRTRVIDKARRVELSHSLLEGEFEDIDFNDASFASGIYQQSDSQVAEELQ